MSSYWYPDFNTLMDAGYQSGARMNIAVNQVSHASLHLIQIVFFTKIEQQRIITDRWTLVMI